MARLSTPSPSPRPAQRFFTGLRLPPSGWALAGMLLFYIVAGLIGRDPWKGEDAIHLAASWHILSHHDWLTPDLAGRLFTEPPLYYWSAALTGKLLGGILPLHDAMRLASGIWVALALAGLYYAARELHGQYAAAAAPMLLAGSAGLIVHAHEAQPMLIALAAHSASLGALAIMHRKPLLGGLLHGSALATALLGNGIAPALPIFALTPFALLFGERKAAIRGITVSLLLATLLVSPWLILLNLIEPGHLTKLLASEFAQFQQGQPSTGLNGYFALLPWFAFPLWPLVIWAIWSQRKRLATPQFALPATLFVLTLFLLIFAYRPKEIPALLLLPPLALLATPGVLSLRRGAANAFDWFGMMTFSFFVGLVWLAWSAMALGWPEKLARRAVVLRPGFVGQFEPLPVILALMATLWWLWLIVTAPRSPYRSLTHWTMGFTTFWLLAAALLLPWFDYGKSYRPVAQAIARALPENPGCVAEYHLNDTQRASLAYFAGIEPYAAGSQRGNRCNWLILAGSPNKIHEFKGAWQRVWDGSRPGDRRERFYLYRRDESSPPPE